MLFDVRQAFGRLIRTTTDTGLFAFLDSRAMGKAYGKQIVGALPNIQITNNLDKPGSKLALGKSYPKLGTDRPSAAASRKTAMLDAED
jgi:Rad3-related DNA helicase